MTTSKATVLYGGGGYSYVALANAKNHGFSPVCICDKNEDKYGSLLYGLPVMSLHQAAETYGDVNIWAAVGPELMPHVLKHLTDTERIQKERILNYEEFEYYRGCPTLEQHAIIKTKCIASCCFIGEQHPWGTVPSVQWDDYNGDLSAALLAFMEKRNNLIQAIKNGEPCGCDGCSRIKTDYYPKNKNFIILSLALSGPCSCACIYCDDSIRPNNPTDTKFDYQLLIELFEKQGLITPDTSIFFSGGEICINPRKREIITAIGKYKATILTNGIMFDKDIAKAVSTPGGNINISIDAGTPETYKLVKRVDAFEKVWENIRAYREHGADVTVKYIFLHENSDEKNVRGFIELARDARINEIHISANNHRKERHADKLIHLMAMMCLLAEQNGITALLREQLTAEDKERIANEILKIKQNEVVL